MPVVAQTVTDQTLAPNQSLVFERVFQYGCDVAFRNGSGSLITRLSGTYNVEFTGNVQGAATTPIQLSVVAGGTPFIAMNQNPGVADSPYNVAGSKYLNTANGCCGGNIPVTITVTNTGANELTVPAGASISVGAMRT